MRHSIDDQSPLGRGGSAVLLDAIGRGDGVESARDDLTGARLVLRIGQTMLKQLGVREDDTELVVQLMEQRTQIVVGHVLRASAHRIVGPRGGCSRRRRFRPTPQRVREDAHRAARRADVLHFAGGDPVVDRATAHTDQFTGFRNGDGLALGRIHIRWRLSARARRGCRPISCVRMAAPAW